MPIASAVAVARKKRLCTFSTTASGLDHFEWTARIDPKQLVLFDVGYVVDNFDPPYRGEKCVEFLASLAVARKMIWTTQKMGFCDSLA